MLLTQAARDGSKLWISFLSAYAYMKSDIFFFFILLGIPAVQEISQAHVADMWKGAHIRLSQLLLTNVSCDVKTTGISS